MNFRAGRLSKKAGTPEAKLRKNPNRETMTHPAPATARARLSIMRIYDLIYFDRRNEGAVVKTGRGRRVAFVLSIVLGVVGGKTAGPPVYSPNR